MITKFIVLLLAVIGQLSDVITTCIALGMGGIEKNLLLGPDPNLSLVLIVKLILVAAVFCLLNGAARIRVLMLGALIGFGAAGWNLYALHTVT